jgi:hypothetical protein
MSKQESLDEILISLYLELIRLQSEKAIQSNMRNPKLIEAKAKLQAYCKQEIIKNLDKLILEIYNYDIVQFTKYGLLMWLNEKKVELEEQK